jgi:hypothetical protein
MKPSLFPEPGIEDAEPVEILTIGLGPQSRALVTRELWADNKNYVIAQEQLLTAVYVAARDDICIRQQDRDIEQEDVCIVLRPEQAPALIRKLQELIR